MTRSLAISLVLHSSIVFSIIFWPSQKKKIQTEKNYIALDIVTQDDMTVIDDLTKKKKLSEAQKPLIVDQSEKALNNETPDNARFFSQNNQVVKRQTRALNRGEFKNARSWKSFQPQAKYLKSEAEKDQIIQQELGDWGNKKTKANKKNQLSRSNDPTQDQWDESRDIASATLDYIKEIDVGLETLLSTKEFKYYTYYRRIRNQLNQHWTPKVRKSVISFYQKGRRVASDRDLVTKTVVVLNPEGYLLKVLVIGDSGFRELDQAALEALKEAAPFKNPPKGMIDPDGLVRIRWDFVIEG